MHSTYFISLIEIYSNELTHVDVVMPIIPEIPEVSGSQLGCRKSPGSFYSHTGAPTPKVLNSFLKILRLSEILKDFNRLIRTVTQWFFSSF